MTKRQAELLAFLRERALAGQVPPSFDEMKDRLGLASKSALFRLLEKLEAQGAIRRAKHRARAIEITAFSEYERGFRDGVASMADARAA